MQLADVHRLLPVRLGIHANAFRTCLEPAVLNDHVRHRAPDADRTVVVNVMSANHLAFSTIDVIFRGAPHMLVVSASPESICPQADVNLALAYFDLMAHSAGVGTVWCGLAKMALELLPELKALVAVPAGHYDYTMLFGVDKVVLPERKVVAE